MKYTVDEMIAIYDRRRTWLKRHLRQEGLSMSAFARMAGVSPSTISRIIDGNDVTVPVWLAIVKATEI